jgi:CYTH domain-containing protein
MDLVLYMDKYRYGIQEQKFRYGIPVHTGKFWALVVTDE